MPREKVARALLWFAVLWWGIWFGGQVFNALMVVPYFSAHPPASLQEWGQVRYHNDGDFFGRGGQSAADAAHHLRMWTHANFLRLLVELAGFVCGVKAVIATSVPAAPPASVIPRP